MICVRSELVITFCLASLVLVHVSCVFRGCLRCWIVVLDHLCQPSRCLFFVRVLWMFCLAQPRQASPSLAQPRQAQPSLVSPSLVSQIIRQIVGQLDRQIVRQLDTQIDRWMDRQMARQVERQIDKQIDRYRQIGRWIGRQIDRQIVTQTGRQRKLE